MVCASSNRIFDPLYSGYRSVRLSFSYGTITLYGRPSQAFRMDRYNPKCGPYPILRWFGLLRFRSPLLTESDKISLFL